MRFVPNKAFPHPVLSDDSDDYIGRKFQAALKFAIDRTNCNPSLHVQCRLSDESLSGLVRSNKAHYVVEIYCARTLLRRITKSNKPDFEIQFERGAVDGRVEINAFVACNKQVNAFHSDNFNPEFGTGASFNLEPGDVLAVQKPIYYWWDTEQVRPIGTVFELVESEQPKPGTFSVLWDEEKIQIRVRKDAMQGIESLRRTEEKKPMLLMSVYFPTLIETLRVMADPDADDDHGEKKWFRAIQHKISEKGISLSDSDFLKHAQELLGLPLTGIIPSNMRK